jgi:hypothetical protein
MQLARQPSLMAHVQKEYPMGRIWRILAVLTLFLSGTLTGGTIWLLCHPAITPFMVPGATDIQVVRTGGWEWQITYVAPGQPYAWYFTLWRTLDAHQWSDRTLIDPARFPQVTPRWFEWDGAGVLGDEVMLRPDDRNPHRATITLRRHFRLPWWPNWSPAAYQGAAIARRELNITLPGQ